MITSDYLQGFYFSFYFFHTSHLTPKPVFPENKVLNSHKVLKKTKTWGYWST